jgi:hypothetical protein
MFDSYATALYSPPHSDAGWSSLVARRAHNPKVVGSNPAPATINLVTLIQYLKPKFNDFGFFYA